MADARFIIDRRDGLYIMGKIDADIAYVYIEGRLNSKIDVSDRCFIGNCEEDNFSFPKTIEVIGVPKNTGQVKYAGELIQKQVEALQKEIEQLKSLDKPAK